MIRFPATSALAFVAAAGAIAQAPASGSSPDPLMAGFRDPPMSARPRAWWHWLNGNITVEGLTKDLEWMKRAGLGGVQAFDASLATPQVVKDRIVYMSSAWKAAFGQAAETANRLGLELAISSSPGWSETGGPWVPPADAMKKLVWSETEVAGGHRFTGKLAPIPVVTGPYGMARFRDPLASFGDQNGAQAPAASGEIRVFAYPIGPAVAARPSATDQAGTKIDVAALMDGREDSSVLVPRGAPGTLPAIALSYPSPTTIRTATLFLQGAVPPFGDPEFAPRLDVQTTDGWRPVATFALGNVPTTISFAPVTGTHFRVVFAPNESPKRPSLAPPARGAVVAGIFPTGPAPTTIEIGTLILSPESKVDRFEAKAGFATVPDYYALKTDATENGGIPQAKVIDLTNRMRADGTLDWTPPAGRWRVVRLGWSLLGTTNHPASVEATGLEVDKYDGDAVRRYMAHYLDSYRAQIRGDGKGVAALLTDSIEAGDANWTPLMLQRFAQLRGYDPAPWLPVLTGAIVGSRAESDAFLYDYRRTLADLVASQHYGTIATIAHENGLKLYGEALEDSRPQLGDDIAMRAHTDVPMAAMWAFGADGAPRSTLIGDVLGAASVAHVYGQNLVAAESFTASFSPWAFAPADLRRVADLEFALGVNRPVIHTSVHSPMDDKEPGLSLAIFGQYFNRHETWAEMARPWVDYLARSSFLLQQGRHVADVAYFFGEEAPLTALYMQEPLASVPVNRGFDFVNADILADQLSVADGEIVAKGGARYRLLYLGGSSQRMTLTTLKRIAKLAEDGATVLGDAPSASPSLDDPAAFGALVRQLWAGGKETRVGRGRVIAGHDIDAAFGTALTPDFSYAGQTDKDMLFQHRALDGADIYFLDNRSKQPMRIDARFRTTGKAAEVWRADTGTGKAVAYRPDGDATIVPLTIGAEESIFVIFRQPTSGNVAKTSQPIVQTIATADGPWQISFQPGRGAPAGTTLKSLAPLEMQADPGIKYFSGVATYNGSVTLPRKHDGKLVLDLGAVGDVAEVRVNGAPVGTVWHAPYRVDIGAVAKPGTNRIEVRVANLWVNRLIGDAQPGATKVAFVTAPTYQPDAPLRPSGLIGPVTVLAEKEGQ